MLEREVKLGAGPAFHLPDLQGVVEGVAVAPPETLRLETVYYDTPDLRLARWGVSLRRRAGEGWTLKLSPSHSGAVLERDEITFEGGTKPPKQALDVVLAYVRRSELVPVARLHDPQARAPGRPLRRASGGGGRRRGLGARRPEGGGALPRDRGRSRGQQRWGRHHHPAGRSAADRGRGRPRPDPEAHPRPRAARDRAARGRPRAAPSSGGGA